VQYAYTGRGYLQSLKDAVGGFTYWTADTVDAEGHLQVEKLINGDLAVNRGFDALTGRLTSVTAGSGNSIANMSFAFDALGNLTRRTDPLTIGDESFCYDALNRLTHDKLASSINCASDSYHHSISYDAILGSSPRSNILTTLDTPPKPPP
jgi:YD repeat-containing protein